MIQIAFTFSLGILIVSYIRYLYSVKEYNEALYMELIIRFKKCDDMFMLNDTYRDALHFIRITPHKKKYIWKDVFRVAYWGMADKILFEQRKTIENV